jgi:pimeloyl-ACP methyl ester carboxylesterase
MSTPAPAAPVIAPLDDALRRAYTLARCVDYGCLPADAQALHDGVAAGHTWLAGARALGEAHERAARRAQAPDAARAAWLAAAACFRVGQAALEDEPDQRLALYLRSTGAFACALGDDAGVQPLQTLHHGRAHGGWLFRAPAETARPGCVLIWGGADGWAEAFHAWVPALHAQGLSVCLTELPGQGLSRLRSRSHLARPYTQMVSTLIDDLSGLLGPQAGRFALIGNSLGGSLAMRAAADDARVAACVTNGGSIDPGAGMAAFPRAARRLCALLGPSANTDDALRLLATLDLPGAARTMTGALLCVHGGQDPLVSDAEVERLRRARADLSLMRWDDGVHCIYNHAAERNTRVSA